MSNKRLRNHANPLNFHMRLPKQDWNDTFNEVDKKPLHFEIGCGRGHFIRQYGHSHPEENLIGVEVRSKMAEIVQGDVKKEALGNVCIIHGTGQICLEDLIEDNSLDKVFVFHPDPWLKDRHNKRRIVQEKLLEVLLTKMKDKGILYLSTDVEVLWNDMQEKLSLFSSFIQVKEDEFWKNDYQTHWGKFSVIDKRNTWWGAYQKQVN